MGQMLAAAEADLEPERGNVGLEAAARFRRRDFEVDREFGKMLSEQRTATAAQTMSAPPAVDDPPPPGPGRSAVSVAGRAVP